MSLSKDANFPWHTCNEALHVYDCMYCKETCKSLNEKEKRLISHIINEKAVRVMLESEGKLDAAQLKLRENELVSLATLSKISKGNFETCKKVACHIYFNKK